MTPYASSPAVSRGVGALGVTPKRDGAFDAVREEVKEGLKYEEDFGNLVEKSDRVLIEIKAVFPFDFFPNEVSVDVNKVNIISNYLLSRRIHSVPIKDICDVYVHQGILFSSLNIIDWGFDKNRPICINYLKIAEAEAALKIIQGLLVGVKQNIDLAKIDVPDFKNKVEILGDASGARHM